MNARKLTLSTLVTLCAFTGVLALASAPALAAPETPETREATGVKNATAVLHGVLNPHVTAFDGWYFSYNKAAGCTAAGASTTPLKPEANVQAGREQQASVAGLALGSEYKACLVARNEAGETSVGNEVTFTTTNVPPILGEQSFSNVGSSSATLHAQIDPEGVPTSYFFEYGPTTAYGSVTPVQSVGSGSESVGVSSTVEGLQPDTAYHFRVVAKNAQSMASYGSDGSFSTFPVGVLGLPDGRGYELVSSLGAVDVTVLATRLPVRAAADGSAVAYIGTAPPVGGNGKGTIPVVFGIELEKGGNAYLAKRSGVGGWTATDIQPAGLSSALYQSFSSDLSVGVLSSEEPVTANAPGSGYNVLYSRSTSNGAYSPLFTKVPSHVRSYQFGSVYAGASLDSSHQLFNANEALLENGSPQAGTLNTVVEKEFAGGRQPSVLYDSVNGVLSVVSVLPDGQVDARASFGSGQEPVVSADGSRVFWSTLEPVEEGGVTRPPSLYVRENDSQPQSPLGPKGECTVPADACTVQVDASHGPGEGGGGVFWAASSDGSRVFFTDEKQLTVGSTAAVGARDLYEYDVKDGALTDLSVDGNVGEHANVVGVLGASETGSYVYFAATGSLANGAKHQECLPTNGVNAKCNVYAVHEDEAPQLVATVTYHDGAGQRGTTSEAAISLFAGGSVESIGDWAPSVGDRSAYVTPDGRHLLFESIEDLTGFDNGGGEEIYMYDFGSGLSCVSCDPAGAPTIPNPGPFSYTHHVELSESFSPTYALRDVSADGARVFFDSKEALVPQDTNGLTDVYEWERNGSGSCERAKGCLFLLSGGTSTDFSLFLDASESGDDVFIQTRAQLVPRDRGEVFEVYDVRVGAPQEPTASACTGSGCQGVPGATPIFATPSSVTFNGVGNFPPPELTVVKAKSRLVKCKRRFVRRKGRCVKLRAKKAGGGDGGARKSSQRSMMRSK